MYVPGSDERKLNKIPQIKADCICLDCEDGVAFTAKDLARKNIRKLLTSKTEEFFGSSEASVRVNSVQSNMCSLDLDSILSEPPTDYLLPSSIHLPKVDDVEILEEYTYLFNAATQDWLNASSTTKIGLIIFIESAKAIIQLTKICEKAAKLREKSALIPEALVFGSDDFVADIGAVRTESSVELLYARQQMGFTGKQVIHPSQVPVVHQAVSPSQSKIEWATNLIKEFREHEKTGKGAFNFRGSMIDMPLVKQAENIITMNEKMKKS